MTFHEIRRNRKGSPMRDRFNQSISQSIASDRIARSCCRGYLHAGAVGDFHSYNFKFHFTHAPDGNTVTSGGKQ